MISEHSFTSIFGAVSADPDTEDSLVHVARAAIDAGYAIVPNRPGTKQPMCTLNATERKRADAAAQAAAQERGVRRWDRVRHDCGVHEAITDRKASDRILRRLVRDFGRINLGIELGRSRPVFPLDEGSTVCQLIVVDVDTEQERAAFEDTWRAQTGTEPPELTIASPGVQAPDGSWVHRGGGHYYFGWPLTDDKPALPVNREDPGVYKDPGGWAAMWSGRQVLVPPSVRPEGGYRLVGTPQKAPAFLMQRAALFVKENRTRRADRAAKLEARIASGADWEDAAIDLWSAQTSWEDLLTADGWVDTGDSTKCGCPEFTAPGDHANPKSATAHVPGCNDPRFDFSTGHGPMHIWTDNPPEGLTGYKTVSKIQYYALTRYGAPDGAALAQSCRDLGIRREGGATAALVGLVSGSGPSTPPAPVPTQRDEVPPSPPSPDPEGHAVPPQPPTPPAPPVVGQDGGPPAPFEQAGPQTPVPPAPESPLIAGLRPLLEGLPAEMPEKDRAEVESKLIDQYLRFQSQKVMEEQFGDELAALEEKRQLRILRARDAARAQHVAELGGTADFAEELYDEADLDQMPELVPLVQGWFNLDSDIRVYGPSGHGKSFAVLDLALCIANGVPWHGVPVRQGKVLYIAAEGARGIKKRIASWRRQFGGTPVRGQFTVKGRPVQLSAPDQLVEAAGDQQYALVILDTQARVTVGLEENSATDHATMTEALRRIRQASGGGSVMLVHHTGKDADAGPRGSSAGTAAMDTEIMIEKKNSVITATITKQKDGADGVSRDFALTPVPDTDSCVLLPMDPLAAGRRRDAGEASGITPITTALDLPAIEGVEEVAALYRAKYELDPSGGFTPEEVRKELLGTLKGGARDRKRKQINRANAALRGSGWITPSEENLSGRENGKHRWRGPEDELAPPENTLDNTLDS